MTDKLRKKATYRFAMAPEALVNDPHVSARAFRLWCLLDRLIGAGHETMPTRRELAALPAMQGASVVSVDRALEELVVWGWLEKKRAGAGDRNVYTVLDERSRKRDLGPLQAAWLTRRQKAVDKRPEPKPKPTPENLDNSVPVQVSGGGVITSEDRGGVITSEDTSHHPRGHLSSPVRTPVLMRGERTTREGSTAAAYSGDPRRPQPELPPPLQDLRTKLDTAKLHVRWDKLDATQIATITQLIDTHGTTRLVTSAQAQHRRDAPAVTAQAWIAGWCALPPPTRRADQCATHRIRQPCWECHLDQLAAG